MSPSKTEGCVFGDFGEPAVVALRFSDGLTYTGATQTFACYCGTHAEEIRQLFVTCDERSLTVPAGRHSPAEKPRPRLG